ncbi:MAG: FAD-dependent oxidoreductase [Pseudomonadota bacterium]
MSKPIIFAVDDDPDVLTAVVRDLRRRYQAEYRIARAMSGPDAMEAVKELKSASLEVALFIVDQRMPEQTGVEFLAEATKYYPEAKRILLTAYADTEVAIRAINNIGLDHYLLKPWTPPDAELYPVTDDLLSAWRAEHPTQFEGVTLVDTRWSARGHELRDFLARNLTPYRWLDAETNPEAEKLMAAAGETARLPIVFPPGGAPLIHPTTSEVADAIGLHQSQDQPHYDVVIIGAGPSGLAAAVYGACEGLSTLVIERDAPGGQAGTSSRIENYLGFPNGLSGRDLSRRALAQAQRFGAEFSIARDCVALECRSPNHLVRLDGESEISAKAVILATGVQYRQLEAPGVSDFEGAGVYYGAATTEAVACKGEDVFIVGAANSAGQGALFLAKSARSVTILCRGPDLRKSMSSYLVDRIEEAENIHVLAHSQVAAAQGSEHLESVTILNSKTGETSEAKTSSLFVFIGAQPKTDWLGDSIARDAKGFIETGPDLSPSARKAWPIARDPFLTETSRPGVFAVGDVRSTSVKRVAAAVGEGSITIQFVHRHISAT